MPFKRSPNLAIAPSEVGCQWSVIGGHGVRPSDYRLPNADSGLPFLLVFDIAADDVGNVGVFFFLLLDESGVVETFTNLHLLFEVRLSGFHRRFRSLRLGIGLFQRNELGFLWLGRRGFFCRNRRGARRGCGLRGFRPRARDRSFYRHHLASVRRDHRILVEVIKLAPRLGTDALGAEFRFRHSRNPSIWQLHLASRAAPVNSSERLVPTPERRLYANPNTPKTRS